jgi:hypothetical protein
VACLLLVGWCPCRPRDRMMPSSVVCFTVCSSTRVPLTRTQIKPAHCYFLVPTYAPMFPANTQCVGNIFSTQSSFILSLSSRRFHYHDSIISAIGRYYPFHILGKYFFRYFPLRNFANLLPSNVTTKYEFPGTFQQPKMDLPSSATTSRIYYSEYLLAKSFSTLSIWNDFPHTRLLYA